jgi:hypothetical protein
VGKRTRACLFHPHLHRNLLPRSSNLYDNISLLFRTQTQEKCCRKDWNFGEGGCDVNEGGKGKHVCVSPQAAPNLFNSQRMALCIAIGALAALLCCCYCWVGPDMRNEYKDMKYERRKARARNKAHRLRQLRNEESFSCDRLQQLSAANGTQVRRTISPTRREHARE